MKTKVKIPKQIAEKFHLYEKMKSGKASAHDLVRLSFLMGMINAEQYADFLQIEKDCEEG
jgi:hypothetical protein